MSNGSGRRNNAKNVGVNVLAARCAHPLGFFFGFVMHVCAAHKCLSDFARTHSSLGSHNTPIWQAGEDDGGAPTFAPERKKDATLPLPLPLRGVHQPRPLVDVICVGGSNGASSSFVVQKCY